jgi:hypothetical protein
LWLKCTARRCNSSETAETEEAGEESAGCGADWHCFIIRSVEHAAERRALAREGAAPS